MHGIEVRPYPDDDSLLVELDGQSSAIEITFSDAGPRVVITLSAVVLMGVRLEDERRVIALERLNALNSEARFGKFVLDDRREAIRLDYDVMGDELDANELLVPFETLAGIADEYDDQLMQELACGHRAADLRALLEEAS